MRFDKMPAVVYTSPEVAVVGLTKEEAEARGLKVKTGRIPMAINARYLAENPDESGLCKVILKPRPIACSACIWSEVLVPR